MIKYDGRWTSGLSPEEKKIILDLLGSNNKVLDKLAEICYNMIKSSEVGDSDFENPNWALKQAHWLGYRKAFRHVIALCQPKERPLKP